MEPKAIAEEILARVDGARGASGRLPDDFVVFRRHPLALVLVQTPAALATMVAAVGVFFLARAAWQTSNWGLGLFAGVVSVVAVSGAFQLRAVAKELTGGPTRRGLLVVTKDFVVKRAEGDVELFSLVDLPAPFQAKRRNRPAALYLARAPYDRETATLLLEPGSAFGSLDLIEQIIRAAAQKRVLAAET